MYNFLITIWNTKVFRFSFLNPQYMDHMANQPPKNLDQIWEIRSIFYKANPTQTQTQTRTVLWFLNMIQFYFTLSLRTHQLHNWFLFFLFFSPMGRP